MGVVWKLGEGDAPSGVVRVTCPWFKITTSVAKRPRVAEECDVNVHLLTPILPKPISALIPHSIHIFDFILVHKRAQALNCRWLEKALNNTFSSSMKMARK
ncbi:hypothetical protein TNCV_5063151 [Trichonephila clavipes]|nr:hypothetical protein TNCV_5063151 [Trichonephila clavipes]